MTGDREAAGIVVMKPLWPIAGMDQIGLNRLQPIAFVLLGLALPGLAI